MTDRAHTRREDQLAAEISARPRAVGRYERTVKPVIDRAVAAALLVALLPLLAAVALGVLVTLGRPLLYRQERIGFAGEAFTMLKFRSMRHDRRRRHASDYDGPERRRRHKASDDPRHTGFGRFMRRFSLDELPQLWNVVRGELSLVGPRPELPEIVARYEPWQHARHVVRPGVTGLWQVTERDHDGEMHRHVHVDLRYVAALSPRLDLWIAVLTIPAVLGLQAGPPRFLDEVVGTPRPRLRRTARVADEANAA